MFHFIAYLPFKGKVYELDGLAPGAVVLGDVPGSGDWFSVVRPELTKRIERYSASEIRFNLLAINKSRLSIAQEELAVLNQRLEAVGTDASAASTPEQLDAARAALMGDIEVTEDRVKAEERKFARYHVENVRRQHNYLGFIVELFSALAEKKQLMPLVDAARDRAETIRKANKERKERAKADAAAESGASGSGAAPAE